MAHTLKPIHRVRIAIWNCIQPRNYRWHIYTFISQRKMRSSWSRHPNTIWFVHSSHCVILIFVFFTTNTKLEIFATINTVATPIFLSVSHNLIPLLNLLQINRLSKSYFNDRINQKIVFLKEDFQTGLSNTIQLLRSLSYKDFFSRNLINFIKSP